MCVFVFTNYLVRNQSLIIYRHFERKQLSLFFRHLSSINFSLIEERSHFKKSILLRRFLHREKLISNVYFAYQLMLTCTPSLKFSKPNSSVFDFSSQSFLVRDNSFPLALAVTFVGLPVNRILMILLVFAGLFAKN